MTEFSIVILILLIRDALSVCCTCSFMLRWLSLSTPKDFTEPVTFNGCPDIEIEVSLITFLSEKVMT